MYIENYIYIIPMLIGAIIGLALISYSMKSLLKLKGGNKTSATVIGYNYDIHSDLRNHPRVTRIQFEDIHGITRECNLNYYNFLWKKGKKITVYYNDYKYWEVHCVQENLFSLFLGLLFFIVPLLSVYT